MASVWFLMIGFLLGNGMPHFVFGVAGKIFRSPFGRRSSPRLNVGWGLSNFLLATALVWWRLSVAPPEPFDFYMLLAGFWLAVIMFGVAIRSFLSEETHP